MTADQTPRCVQSDLPVDQCAHCGAHPGDRPDLTPAPVAAAVRHDLFAETPTPADPGPPLKLTRHPELGVTCACDEPTRNGAYGCDDCANELSRFLSDIPWILEQLEASTARIRAKNPAAGGGQGGQALPWLDRAAVAHRRVTGLLNHLVRLCERVHVPNQSPYPGPPTEGPIGDARWLSWRVDGLTNHVALFPEILRAAMHTERRVLAVIDCAPDLLYLGPCEATNTETGHPCRGPVYAIAGEPHGRCRACRGTLLTEPARAALYAELDARLCTSAEIARLATYLGIEAPRERVRKLVDQWHSRGRLAAHGHVGTGDRRAPQFRYGEVRTLLAQTYDKDPS